MTVARSISYSKLTELAAEFGLQSVGVSTLPLNDARDRAALSTWQANGMAGEMSYMNRSPVLLGSPQNIFPEVRSIVCFAIYYHAEKSPVCPPGFGRVARYAVGRDYHRVLKKRLKLFCLQLQEVLQMQFRFRVVTDSIPLLERHLGRAANLGFTGKNTMLIQPGRGSFFFLAELLWDLEVVEVPEVEIQGTCGSCRSCLDSCPTDAFDKEFVLDARKCISYLTIEKKGSLLPAERSMLGEWIFGCDVCQEVCPFNHRALKLGSPADYEEFKPNLERDALLDLSKVLKLSSRDKFLECFAGTPLMRAGPVGLIRNALCVAANTASVSLVPEISELFETSNSAIIRQHAIWALHKLTVELQGNSSDTFERLLGKALKDPEPIVKAEAEQLKAS